MKTYLRLMLFIFCVYFPAMCSPSPRRSPRVEPYGWLSGFVVFTCSFCLFLTPLIHLQLVHEVLACFFPQFFQLGVHRFLAPKPSRWILRLTICVCRLYMFLLPVSYAFALPPARTWGPGLFFFTKQIPLGLHRFLAEALALNLAADYPCLSSLHVPSACFLYIGSTSSSYMRPWLVLSKKIPYRCAPIPRRRPRVESCGWLSVFVVFTCSFCLFLTH